MCVAGVKESYQAKQCTHVKERTEKEIVWKI